MSSTFEVRLANGKQFPAQPGVSLLDSAGQAGFVLEHSCRTGRCGACKTRLVSGQVQPILTANCLSDAEQEAGWILTCASAAVGPLTLETEDLGALADIKTVTLPARIDALEKLSSDVIRVRLRLPPNQTFRYLPGQYVNIFGPDGVKRPYSIANAPQADGRLEFHIRRVPGGTMSRFWFDTAKVNDLIRFEGPRGSFYLRPVSGISLVLMTTGTGFAPVQALLQEVARRPVHERPCDITLLWGGRQRSDFYLTPPAFGSDGPVVEFIPTLSRADSAWTGSTGYVQDVFLRGTRSLGNTWVYACGSDAMIHSAQEALIRAGLPVRQFLSDAFLAA